MIGSFGRVFVRVQVSVKIPGLRPPDGELVVSTGAVEEAPEPADVPDPDDMPVLDDVGNPDADARLTATIEETAAADAAARITTPEAARTYRGRLVNMSPVNVRESREGCVFTLPEQRPSTATTFG